tara:strand:- start:349 stop:960 length:612 start_codon:yes stop_codon:yes gene_type:complete
MAANNLGDLRALVKDWGNRTDISDPTLNSFINIALDRATRVLRLPVSEDFTTIAVYANELTLPSNYIETKSLTVGINGRTVELQRKDLAFVSKQISNETGQPKYFARKQNKFIIGPSSTITTADLYYYYATANLVSDTDTNWFVQQATSMLIYGSLVELSLYTKNPEEAAQWEGKFRAEAAELVNMADNADWSGSSISIIPMR